MTDRQKSGALAGTVVAAVIAIVGWSGNISSATGSDHAQIMADHETLVELQRTVDQLREDSVTKREMDQVRQTLSRIEDKIDALAETKGGRPRRSDGQSQ